MPRQLISSGSTFEQEIGYSRAVVDGDWIFVSGTTGFDYGKMTISDDLLEQAEQCFKNIQAALNEAGASLTRCCPGDLRIAGCSGFPQVLADPSQISGRDQTRGDDDFAGLVRSAHAYRNPGDRPAEAPITA